MSKFHELNQQIKYYLEGEGYICHKQETTEGNWYVIVKDPVYTIKPAWEVQQEIKAGTFTTILKQNGYLEYPIRSMQEAIAFIVNRS